MSISQCDCKCGLLAAEIEGIKLDMVIMQRNIESKMQPNKIGESDESKRLEQELYKAREECKNLKGDIQILITGRNNEIADLNQTIVSLENTLKTSKALNMSLSGQNKRLEQDLVNAREKCKHLEDDIQVLMSGRNNEIADVNQTVVSPENKLKISEALNASLSGKIASINASKSTKTKQRESYTALPIKFQDRNEEMQRQINSLKEKVNDPLHELEFEYANIEQSSLTNKVTNLSPEVINNKSNLEAFVPEKGTDDSMPTWAEASHSCPTTRISSSEPELQLHGNHVETNGENFSEIVNESNIIMPTVPTVNTKTTSDVDTEISGSNDQLELNSDSNAQQTELTTCINASLINCLEQKQIPTITTDPVSCSITRPNSVFSAPVNNLNLPLIEFPPH